MTELATELMTTLECDHCGGDAIERLDGIFGEDMGGACITCGYPGHVSLEESGYEDDEGEPVFTAWWRSSIDANATCDEDGCDVCVAIKAKEKKR